MTNRVAVLICFNKVLDEFVRTLETDSDAYIINKHVMIILIEGIRSSWISGRYFHHRHY